MTREEAIEVYNGLINTKIKEAFEFFAPELRESEDERIRKGMIRFLESEQAEGIFTHEARLSWIAYLEKQKEQKPWKVGANAYFTPEQKPVEWSEDTVPVRFEEEDGEKYPVVDYKLMGQKPAEKQDYSGLNDLERAIHRGFLCAGMENVPVTIIKETAQECLAQMKPAEWSEEDEDMLNSCISSIEEAKENRYAYKETDGDTSYDREINWLKSLRPSWKPSEEQIEALLWCAAHLGGADHRVLAELYEHLKMYCL